MKILIQNNKIINDIEYNEYVNNPKKNKIREKNIKEVKREFDDEEWKNLYKEIRNIKTKITINAVDRIYNEYDKKIIYYDNENFYKDSTKNVINRYHQIYLKTIKKYLLKNNKNNLVELGSGYGSKILNLTSDLNKNFKDINYYAGEFSLNGRKITKRISNDSNLNIKVFNFNFLDKKTYKNIPYNSIIFTSYSSHYIKKLKGNYSNFLQDTNPKIIINFEPLYESHNVNSKYGRMCMNYIKLNGYCLNHLSFLNDQQKIKKIKIISIKKNIFGSNPFFPISEIIWR